MACKLRRDLLRDTAFNLDILSKFAEFVFDGQASGKRLNLVLSPMMAVDVDVELIKPHLLVNAGIVPALEAAPSVLSCSQHLPNHPLLSPASTNASVRVQSLCVALRKRA